MMKRTTVTKNKKNLKDKMNSCLWGRAKFWKGRAITIKSFGHSRWTTPCTPHVFIMLSHGERNILYLSTWRVNYRLRWKVSRVCLPPGNRLSVPPRGFRAYATRVSRERLHTFVFWVATTFIHLVRNKMAARALRSASRAAFLPSSGISALQLHLKNWQMP